MNRILFIISVMLLALCIYFWVFAQADKVARPHSNQEIVQQVVYNPIIPPAHRCEHDKVKYSDDAELFAWRVFSRLNSQRYYDYDYGYNNNYVEGKTEVFWGESPGWRLKSDDISNIAPFWASMINHAGLKTAEPPFIQNSSQWQCQQGGCLTTEPPGEEESHVLLDRKREPIYYERRFNQAWLYSTMEFDSKVNGYTTANLFHMGRCKSASALSLPSIMIKLAWKILDKENEDPSRYITMKPEGGPVFALVGMHIAAKTRSKWPWIWSTFEHINNFSDYEFNKDNKTIAVSANFKVSDSECDEQFKPNCIPKLVPFEPKEKQTADTMNHLVQKEFAKLKSPLQYYRMLGVQYASEKDLYSANDPDLKESCKDAWEQHRRYFVTDDQKYLVLLKKGNLLVPDYCHTITEIVNPMLYNPVFEPFADNAGEASRQSCIGCHVNASYSPDDDDTEYHADFTFAPSLFGINKDLKTSK